MSRSAIKLKIFGLLVVGYLFGLILLMISSWILDLVTSSVVTHNVDWGNHRISSHEVSRSVDHIVDESQQCSAWLSLSREHGHRRIWSSQFGQDFFVWANFFYEKRNGVYVDVGANHPYVDSNTYVFDKCLRWHGLCIEANPEFVSMLRADRSCEVLSFGVSSHDGAASMQLGNMGTGRVVGVADNDVVDTVFQHKSSAPSVSVNLKNITSILKSRGISHIDFMSIDVEGSELSVLLGIDFSAITIDVIAIENMNFKLDIREYLTLFGYTYVMSLGVDEIYVYHPVVKYHMTDLYLLRKFVTHSLYKKTKEILYASKKLRSSVESGDWRPLAKEFPDVLPDLAHPL